MRLLTLFLIGSFWSFACRQPTSQSPDVQPGDVPYQSSSFGEGNQQVEIKVAPPRDRGAERHCAIKDGIHAATVGYYNPRTGHTATYALNVHIENCHVFQIDFPNGGWLDEDHISRTPLNQKGKATLKDDKGREWTISIR